MFAQFPKLFDRNFAVGYFLPFAIFLATVIAFLDLKGVLAAEDQAWLTKERISGDLLIGTTLLGLVTWIGSVALLFLNRGMIRFLEGYGPLAWLWLPRQVQLQRYRELHKKLTRVERQWRAHRANGEPVPPVVKQRRADLLYILGQRFPDREGLVLSTALGNRIRAFEVYPRVMYGLEGIQGWLRLLAVMSNDFREAVEEAKVKLDFWVNVFWLSTIFIVVFFAMAHLHSKVQPNELLMPLAALIVLVWSYLRAINAAELWGQLVKAGFDLYRGELAEKLGYTLPDDATQARDMWTKFSQAIIHREPNWMP